LQINNISAVVVQFKSQSSWRSCRLDYWQFSTV